MTSRRELLSAFVSALAAPRLVRIAGPVAEEIAGAFTREDFLDGVRQLDRIVGGGRFAEAAARRALLGAIHCRDIAEHIARVRPGDWREPPAVTPPRR